MEPVELILILLVVVCGIAVVARKLSFSYPIAFVLGGMGLALLPQFPAVAIPPEAMLLIFLPPLLCESAYFTSVRDLRKNMRPVLQLALGLVVVTCLAVGFASWWLIPGLPLAAALVLGAIVSPPDAVAASAVLKKVHVPRRIVTILEGESLLNDATGLVLYKFAVMAVVTGMFSLQQASLHFAWMVAGGVSIGFVLAWVYMRLFHRIKEMSVEILTTLLVPYAAYIAAEAVHASGVLAVVTAGLVVGWRAPLVFSPALRLSAETVWQMVVFVLNGFVFLLIGLQFPGLLARLSEYTAAQLLTYAAVVSLTAVAVRFAWVYSITHVTRWLFPAYRKQERTPPWQNVFVVAWTGMRGVVSLATALALPLTMADGTPFPARDLIIFLAFSVILVTLVIQGISLPWVLRKLGLIYEATLLHEDWEAKKEAAEAALSRLTELSENMKDQPSALERLYAYYQDRLSVLGDGPNTPLNPKEPPSPVNHPLIQIESRLWQEALEAERDAVICLRQTFRIGDDVMHDRLREIDLMHNRFAA